MPALRYNTQSTNPSYDDPEDDRDGIFYVGTISNDGDTKSKGEMLSEKWLPKAVALCKHLWPSAKHDTLPVKYLAHGSNNLVFSFTMMIIDDESVDYILRIPEAEDAIRRSVAILDLDAVFDGLSHDQRLLLAKQLAQLHKRIESITNPVAGTINVHETNFQPGDDPGPRTFLDLPGSEICPNSCNPVDWSHSENEFISLDRLRRDIMLAIIQRRRYQAKYRKMPWLFRYKIYRRCQKMVESMTNFGLFKPQNDIISLVHPNLWPRNIMVDFTPDIVITGTLDWDEAMFAPRFVSRIPPRWLWCSCSEDEDSSRYTGFQMEPLDPKENNPDSPENAEIKRVFDDAMGKSWVSEATGNGYAIARQLYMFSLRTAFQQGCCIPRMFRTIKIWNRLHTAITSGSDHSLEAIYQESYSDTDEENHSENEYSDNEYSDDDDSEHDDSEEGNLDHPEYD
ncbi:uncharacterized protein F4822DRAFT_444901 [Hypoxylon trugodes]|uniref:uncharacterized protein n=1 Tax=Hypoxylon trugodes TaxID=326681 RepID=UPI002195D13B|nr:uncharacterized protein F4822DRAFT_444901 [Hypoxylon trugodes]KAI1386520.1 hypothetical protein F4822DRAFT_444901 [Hypoxylon trugodes]